MSAHNKKGMEIAASTLVGLILLFVSAVLLIGVITYSFAKAEDKTSEKFCRGFNAIRYGTQLDAKVTTVQFPVKACKTIDKADLPGPDYKDNIKGESEAAKFEIRDMVAKCWWMWLEGKQPNMFDGYVSTPNRCFVCYTFSLQNKAGTIKWEDFMKSLDEPYDAADSSDKCRIGGGGFCKAACDSVSETEAISASNKCNQKKNTEPKDANTPSMKCCVSKDSNDECTNKGGKCEPERGYVYYGKWSCPQNGACYIKKENYISYLDYIQGTKGTGGPGYLLYEDEMLNGFNNQKKYAITMISPPNSWSWESTINAAATAGTGALTFYFAEVPFVLKAGVPATALLAARTLHSGSANPNLLYISSYDEIQSKCVRDLGVAEK